MNIQYTKQAVKQINELDKATKQRMKNGIEKLPLGDIKKLQGYNNTYRLRVGDYRVIFEFINDSTILISKIKPRGNAYK